MGGMDGWMWIHAACGPRSGVRLWDIIVKDPASGFPGDAPCLAFNLHQGRLEPSPWLFDGLPGFITMLF